MPVSRRRFMQSLAVAAAAPAVAAPKHAGSSWLGKLRPDPNRIMDLPPEFSYQIVSRAGDLMADGLRVPNAHDGMGAFAAKNGRVVLICNHELEHGRSEYGAFSATPDKLPGFVRKKIYDAGSGISPMTGGTTTTIYDPTTGTTERQHLSLAGTELNCAGGVTPWGSWLSCEECVKWPGTHDGVHRDQAHGYVFEVPANANGLVKAEPIRAMGKFEHEAAAVDPATGIVYMTEDKHHSLFYRYLPNIPGKLIQGGRLQALAIIGRPSQPTHNWSAAADVAMHESMPVTWIDLDDIDGARDDLRARGAANGGAMFARGEGLCMADGFMAFTCTIGGRVRLGQVFTYTPSSFEGTSREAQSPGQLALVAESDKHSLLHNADNITASPWGDLLVCEDTSSHCGVVGIRPDGTQYEVCDNAYSDSELAGACFSPDGTILFVNIQYPGMTLAITGPWPAA